VSVIYVIAALLFGLAAGWHARGASVAGTDLRGAKAKIPVLRRNRARGAAIAGAVLAAVVLVLYDLARASS
jgi:hypothetical protein